MGSIIILLARLALIGAIQTGFARVVALLAELRRKLVKTVRTSRFAV